MVLTLRKIQVVISSLIKTKITNIHEPAIQNFHVGFLDLDENLHMNNGRYVNYMEVGRWALMSRSGFVGLAIKKGWVVPLASLKLQNFKEMRVFQKFSVRTQVIYWDEKWIYAETRFESKGRVVAAGAIRSVIKKGRETIPPEDAFKMLNLRAVRPTKPNFIEKWFEADSEIISEFKK